MVSGVDDKVFGLMTTAADKTAVDLFPPEKEEISSKNIHHALMAAGMSPAYGNIADVADATLYALEGEFGEAGWSLASVLPVAGQMVASKRLLKAAKESGEEMVTLYRGVPDWFQGKMIKDGKFVSPQNQKYYDEIIEQPTKQGIYVGDNIDVIKGYAKKQYNFNPQTGKKAEPRILEFEIPKKWLDKNIMKDVEIGEYWIDGGIPKEFLKKVHK